MYIPTPEYVYVFNDRGVEERVRVEDVVCECGNEFGQEDEFGENVFHWDSSPSVGDFLVCNCGEQYYAQPSDTFSE